MFERKKPSGKLLSLPIDQIHPSPFQARKSFDEQELTALAQSIRENGLLQPVTVRKAAEGYELVVQVYGLQSRWVDGLETGFHRVQGLSLAV